MKELGSRPGCGGAEMVRCRGEPVDSQVRVGMGLCGGGVDLTPGSPD